MIILHPQVRRATQADIPEIQRLLDANGYLVRGLNWSEIDNNWRMVEYKGKSVGCFHMLIGKPIGTITYLMVDPEYHGSGVGYVMIKIIEAIFGYAGTDCFLTCTSNEWILNKMKELGLTDLGEGHTVCKRVKQYALPQEISNRRNLQ